MNSDENVVELEQISAMKNNKLVRIVLNVKNNYPTLPLETIKLQVTSPSGDT